MEQINVKILILGDEECGLEGALLLNDELVCRDSELDVTLGEMEITLEDWKASSLNRKLSIFRSKLVDVYREGNTEAYVEYLSNSDLTRFKVLEDMNVDAVSIEGQF